MDLRVAISKACHPTFDYLYSLFGSCSAALRIFRAPVPLLTWLCLAEQPSCKTVNPSRSESAPLHIIGLGTEWPSVFYGPETFEEYIRQHYDATKPG